MCEQRYSTINANSFKHLKWDSISADMECSEFSTGVFTHALSLILPPILVVLP